ncbi:sigma-70 family RNA polymerase sigma factor [Xanthomonas euroxanthea]|uniref:sigma-70 family RNA polymerase sigma factor n=1 Tax=Xanthomonas euroxanthea TaxID=2259622 RepID=UPI001613CCE0|nr:sigma-70 family RNA polymerase sigma factor [Xanthomonas euroxanthea]MBB5769421.1 RNA polymerase sigma-70 factor (ECF subfamily) [Xanthomonas euroxanthea]
MAVDHSLLASLYRDHQPWLQRWVGGRVGSREVAQDLTQDTFTRLLSGRDLCGLNEPRAFLTTVAKGLMANWFRRQSLERAYLESLTALPEAIVPSEEERAIVCEALCLIDALLEGLPVAVRQVFLLAQFEGLGYGEIGCKLDLSLSTVKRHMKRAWLACLAYAP